jgi:hypothetical protein
VKPSRLTRLERRARERPCPGCGRTHVPRSPSAAIPDPTRLSAVEQRELAGLLAAASTLACSRCGRSGHDLSRMTDEQLDRALRLLQKLLGPTAPALAGFCETFSERSST